MNNALFVIGIISFFGCNNFSDKSFNQSEEKTSAADSVKPFVFDCFQSVDSTKGKGIGCSNTFFKIIDKKYVLRIEINIPVQYDSCVGMSFDSSSSKIVASLVIYKDGEANLFPYCNDYGNDIVPIKTLTKGFGKIYVKFFKPTEYTGSDDPTASIFVRDLVFIDDSDNSRIEFMNELFWKVVQYGPAG